MSQAPPSSSDAADRRAAILLIAGLTLVRLVTLFSTPLVRNDATISQ